MNDLACCLLLGWVAITSQALTGCQCDQRLTEPAPSAAPSSAYDAPTPKPALKGPAPLVLTAVPGKSSGTWTIVARSPKLELDEALLTVSESTLCGVFSSEEVRDGEEKVADTILLTCSATEKYWIMVENRVLRLGEKRYPIAGGIQVTLPNKVQQPPAPPCPADTPRVEVPVKLVHQRLKSPKTPDEPYQMLLSAGQQEIMLRSLADYPMGCDSQRVFPKSTELRAGCSYTEAGFRIHAFVKDRDLWVEEFHTGYHDPEPQYRVGRRLPCGSEVRFSRFHLVHRGWKSAFGD